MKLPFPYNNLELSTVSCPDTGEKDPSSHPSPRLCIYANFSGSVYCGEFSEAGTGTGAKLPSQRGLEEHCKPPAGSGTAAIEFSKFCSIRLTFG